MTSNIGSAAIAASGARSGDAAYEEMKREVTEALGSHFRPEFLNRVDEVIVFHALTEADLERIVDLLVADLAQRLAEPGHRPRADRRGPGAARPRGHRPGVRGPAAQADDPAAVENPLARALVAGEFQPGDRVDGRRRPRDSGTLVFSTGDATVVTDERAEARRADPPASSRSRRCRVRRPPVNCRRRRARDGELVNCRGSTSAVRRRR